MKTMTIYKKKAIEAIETEPVLASEGWFSDTYNRKNCSVCAVGSVLRKHCFTNKFKNHFGGDVYPDESEVIDSGLENGYGYIFNKQYKDDPSKYSETDHLTALSTRFETLSEHGTDPNSDIMRAELINMILAEWPTSFKVTFDEKGV